MSDQQEVRLAVQRALDKLIGRFGTTSAVIDELRHALAILDRKEAPGKAAPVVPAAGAAPDPEPVTETAPIEEAGEAEPPPETPRPTRSMGRKK